MRRSDRPVAVVEPPGVDPLLQDVLLAGDIGGEGNDTPVRLGSALPRRRLQNPLVPRHDRYIDPFTSQFLRNGLPMPQL
jgi:hypothetical protein